MFYFFLFPVLLSCCGTSVLGDPEAFECSVRFPTPRKSVISAYDGNDLIYIFGGERTNLEDHEGITPLPLEIIKYNISADRMEVVGHLPEERFGGTGVFDQNGDIILFAGKGINQNTEILKFNPSTSELIEVWEEPPGWLGAVRGQLVNQTHLIICEARSVEGNVFWYDIKNNVTTNIGHVDMHEKKYYDCVYHAKSDTLFVFGIDRSVWDCVEGSNAFCSWEIIAKFEIGTGVITEIQNKPMQGHENQPSVIWDGKHFYIVGGKLNWELPWDEVVRFDPETEEYERLHVHNFPTVTQGALGYTEAVYIPKFNRIYIIAGGQYSRGSDKVWYIQLE